MIRNDSKCSETIQKCCELGPKIVQIAKQKVAFILSAGGICCTLLLHIYDDKLTSTATAKFTKRDKAL